MPVIVQFNYEDGTNQLERIPAQVWRHNENSFSKIFLTKKKVTSIQLDPFKETADIDESNNFWGKLPEEPSKFAIFKANAANPRNGAAQTKNPMQIATEKK